MQNLLTLLPPLICLIIAIWKRKVILALTIGNVVGYIILHGVDFVQNFLKDIYFQLIDPAHFQVIFIMLIIAAFVSLLDKSGGAQAFAEYVTRWIDTRQKAMAATMLTGIAIFFTDSGNSLILGPLYRPIYDKLKICREKLAYILDSTSSPVCILVPFISWGLYIMGLIESSFKNLGINETGFETFIKLYPYQFYPIYTLIFAFIISVWGKDFGLMKKFQNKTSTKLSDDQSTIKATKLRFILLPLFCLFLFIVIGLLGVFVMSGNISGSSLRFTLITSYLFTTLILVYLLSTHGILKVKESLKVCKSGIKGMLLIPVILILAWMLSDLCFDLKTADTITSLLSGSLSPKLIPVLIFLVGIITSFCTGSSWGTMAIVMPLAINMGHAMEANILVTIAAVLSGSLFGDHTSPISDTTLLASISSECKHIDHVKTQLNYALIPGTLTLISLYLCS